ncbi:hypothetical protein KSX_05040 [Ktedonospora formicarum]|uniref:Uncharacterized protein n=1 Tax=Ktedonospora formicarum TaxID=2778364 RepID=A0A8J3MQ24_9CHLR|nr:hypothetical protein KSX_05040 [Ktedonospora formicarum]
MGGEKAKQDNIRVWTQKNASCRLLMQWFAIHAPSHCAFPGAQNAFKYNIEDHKCIAHVEYNIQIAAI